MNYFGIRKCENIDNQEALVLCSACCHLYYEYITDERDDNALKLFFQDEEYFLGCPSCKTDCYLLNVDYNELDQFRIDWDLSENNCF